MATPAARTESAWFSIVAWTCSTMARWWLASMVVVIFRPPVLTASSVMPLALSSASTRLLISPLVPSATEPELSCDGSVTSG